MSPATLDRLMIEPPVGFIAGSAARQPRNVPSTLTRYISRKSASVVDSMSPKRPMPAELSKTSRRPWRATRSATTRGQASSSVTSRTAVVCGAPSAAASAARPISSRSVATIVAPSAARRSAAARPMPDAAPVMSATLPATRPARAVSFMPRL